MNERYYLGKTFLRGFAIGTSDLIPGISGGTMAIVLGIYRNLVNALKSFNWVWFKAVLSLKWKTALGIPHFKFLIPLFFGAISAVLFFTQVVILSDFLKEYPTIIYSVFFGLVSGSTIVILREIKVWFWKGIIVPTTLGLMIGAFILTAVPNSTPEDSWFLFLSGLLAGSAMITPGISGAFVLIILGKYAFILDALNDFQLRTLLPFGLGIATALIFFVRLISFLLEKYETKALAIISGFLVASLWKMWPFQSRTYEHINAELIMVIQPIKPNYDFNFFLCILLMTTCAALVIGINIKSKMLIQDQKDNKN